MNSLFDLIQWLRVGLFMSSAEMEQQLIELQKNLAAQKEAEAAQDAAEHPEKAVETAIAEIEHLGTGGGDAVYAKVGQALRLIYEYLGNKNGERSTTVTGAGGAGQEGVGTGD